jgi:hypothetical protein
MSMHPSYIRRPTGPRFAPSRVRPSVVAIADFVDWEVRRP